MRVLFIGDIVGSPGREIVRERLADVVSQKKIDLVIANGGKLRVGIRDYAKNCGRVVEVWR